MIQISQNSFVLPVMVTPAVFSSESWWINSAAAELLPHWARLPVSSSAGRTSASVRAAAFLVPSLWGCATLPRGLRASLCRMSAVLLISSLQWDGFLCSDCDKSLFSSPTYPGLLPLSAFFCFDTCIYVLISVSLLGPYCFSFLTQSSSATKTDITDSAGLRQ